MSRFAAHVSRERFRNLTPPDLAAEYRAAGWWGDTTLAEVVAGHASSRPDAAAYHTEHGTTTWAQYDAKSSELAAVLVASGMVEGERMAVWLPDGATVHITYLAAEKAGISVVGIGARAGEKELHHLLATTGATALVTFAQHRGRDLGRLGEELRAAGVRLERHIVVPLLDADHDGPVLVEGEPIDGRQLPPVPAERAMGPDDLFMMNSTSGTTGMPKCVMHHQNRWFYFHQQAEQNGDLVAADVWYGAVPAPFGFGLWTVHFTPAILGCATVLRERFDAEEANQLIEDYGVTVLASVSTQFIMMLNSESIHTRDLSSLRAIFTGGEAVPALRARAFEETTGATVLQFFGSNETGLLTGTTLRDSFDKRVTTAGRVVPEMNVRLFDGDRDVTESGTGQPAGHGPALCLGYLDDDAANDQLYTKDGWMLMGDIVTIDDEGYLTLTGRTSDIIIRGGKNISAGKVEEEVSTHPAVALAAAVAAPDSVFGERVCVFVELKASTSLDLESLQAHLIAQGTSKSDLPEYLVVLDRLPRASGAKVAKGELRAKVTEHIATASR
jgi:acyl-CoA synthetase